jgi:hypothetical protein
MKSGAAVLACALVLGAPACFATTSDPEYMRERRHGTYYERGRGERHHHSHVERAPDAYRRERAPRGAVRESAPPARDGAFGRESAPPARRVD